MAAILGVMNPSDRPDWVHCIRKPKEAEKRTTWCGRHIEAFEFALEGLDHAASLQNDRLQPCAECVAAAVAELESLACDDTALAAEATATPSPESDTIEGWVCSVHPTGLRSVSCGVSAYHIETDGSLSMGNGGYDNYIANAPPAVLAWLVAPLIRADGPDLLAPASPVLSCRFPGCHEPAVNCAMVNICEAHGIEADRLLGVTVA